MIEKIKEHLTEVEAFQSSDSKEIESFRVKYAGKKGLLNDFFAAFRDVPADQKKEFGQVLRRLYLACHFLYVLVVLFQLVLHSTSMGRAKVLQLHF